MWQRVPDFPHLRMLRRKNFANKDWVKVPKIDWDHTTSEILTMEYCPGIKINRAQQLDAQVRPRCSPCLAAHHI
jgi:predicted unusual protein kinase regulating ubiquinone biosynthesis (AarF/ABC1/UbiB family)